MLFLLLLKLFFSEKIGGENEEQAGFHSILPLKKRFFLLGFAAKRSHDDMKETCDGVVNTPRTRMDSNK